MTFREANALVRGLLATQQNLLITPDYSKDAEQICSRCVPKPAFPLADPQLVLSLLGYCSNWLYARDSLAIGLLFLKEDGLPVTYLTRRPARFRSDR